MTGVTHDLTRHQLVYLDEFFDGQPRWRSRRPDNLIRRGILQHEGKGFYRITEFGKQLLVERGWVEKGVMR